jgi:xanthine dehydrogenase accessory factor
MSDELLDIAADNSACGESFALVTITDTTNSAPRKVGSKMIVYEDGEIDGTIGGGAMEAFVIEEAKKAIETGKTEKVEHQLEPGELNMYCGGTVEFFIDVHQREFHLIQFGAGHVGEAVARVAEAINRPYTIMDDREEFADPAKFPGANEVIHCDYLEAFDKINVDENTYLSIITRCHDTDIMLMEEALETDAAYIGMIGSDTKAIRLFRNLEEATGKNPADDPRVYAPIGLELGGSEPGDIAISVWSEILKLHSEGSGDHYRLDEDAKERARARDDKEIGDEVEDEPISVESDTDN